MENNPYYEVHLRGLERQRQREQSHATAPRWHDDVTRYLDDSDMLDNPLRVAHATFSSVPPSTNPKIEGVQLSGTPFGLDVPREVFVKMFMEAWRARGMAIMSARQRLAWEAYEEAQALGVAHGEHIAKRLGCSRNAAYLYLNKIRTKLTERYGADDDIMRKIRVLKRETPRKCALCDTVTPAPDKPLCTHCHDRFVVRHAFGGYHDMATINQYIAAADRQRHQDILNQVKGTRQERVF